MSIVLIIEVKNQLVNSQRCINVYHHHTGIADIICFNQSISLSLREITGNRQRDYLQISVEKEAKCSRGYYLIDLPSWAHFQVNLKGRSGIAATYAGNRHILKLTLSYDFWQMKIFKPTGNDFSTNDSVTIQDRPGHGARNF
jgi:hypothetical protein